MYLWTHQVNANGFPVVSCEGLTACKIAIEAIVLWTEWWEALWLTLLANKRASLVTQMTKNPPVMGETWVLSLGREDPLDEGMATHSSITAWRVPWTQEPGGVTKSQTWLKQLGTAHTKKWSWNTPGLPRRHSDRELACQFRRKSDRQRSREGSKFMGS